MKLPRNKNLVVYFCAEFGIDSDLPTYSGGLGILAGDFVNAAADQDFPLIGIGILYKGKEFIQHITGEGKEEKRDSEFDHDTSFLRPTTKGGKPLVITIPLEDVDIKVKSYHIRLSDQTILFFLSTDVDGNPQEWISDMDALYKGDIESQIRQQILLGIGGVRLLNTLGFKPNFYHINEGRAEFIIWEITEQISKNEKLPFKDAWEAAKQKIIYTNHTLIDAGNPKYPMEIVEKWANPFAKRAGVDTKLLIRDGLENNQTFNTTLFALNISNKQSAVSKIHGQYAKNKWPDYQWIPITNGVYLPRWQDSDFRTGSLTDKQIWSLHLTKKRELVETVKKRTGFEFNPEKLVITWARRLAEYKQPRIIFENIDRLKNIISKSNRPVQLLFAGNSHTADPNAKSIIEEVIRIFSSQLSDHAIFIPNYNIALANHLVSGSDVWLNTPKGNLEACGTSGMKVIANGVLNCTVIDGWAHELNWKDIGWTLDPQNVSVSFYNILEREIVPCYYKRGRDGIPYDWVKKMKKSIEESSRFSAGIMLEEYRKKLYS